MLADIRYAVRSLRRWRVGASMAVATLTIGIGTATSLYVFLRAALAGQTPHIEDIGALGRIYAANRSLGVERAPLTLAAFQSVLATSSFESLAAYAVDDRAVRVGAVTVTIPVGQFAGDFFDVLRSRPSRGRLMSSRDARVRDPVVVVSDSFWRNHGEGGAPGEATLSIDGTEWTVIGVLPAEFRFPFLGIAADVWMPMPRQVEPTPRPVSVIARLKEDRSWAAASAELDAAARALNPDGLWTWRAIPVREDLGRRVGTASAFLLGPAFVVLLIGCVNVSCMLLARGIERDAELTIRAALGATRARIVRELVAEQLLLAGSAGAFGWLLALGILRVIAARMAAFQAPSSPELSLDASTIVAAAGVSLLAAVLFGALPAIRLSRRDVASSLKGATAVVGARFSGYQARDLVVFVEFALAVVLIVVAAMWLELFAELHRITPVFAAEHVVAAPVESLDASRAANAVSSVAGVAAVSVVSALPGGRSGAVQLQSQSGRVARAARVEVQPSFFDTVGLPILQGRSFDSTEAHAPPTAVVVSESLASDLWPNENPLGSTVTIRGSAGAAAATVIGVCADALKLGALAKAGVVAPDVYVPFAPRGKAEFLVLARVNGDAHAFVRPIEEALSHGQSRPRHAAVVADEKRFVRDESVFLVRLIGAFGLIALGLAATGIFGVLSQSVSQRTREFGVRMAMGATPRDILLMVVAREAKLIAAAMATGAAGTVLVTRSVFAELVTIAGRDIRLWLVVTLLCGAFAAAAALLATRRIVRLEPWTVLRMP